MKRIKFQDKLNNKPLSRVYIKCYALLKKNHNIDGITKNIIFYKDGYTSLTGKFDYASLNTQILPHVIKFSIFVHIFLLF